MIDYTKDSMQLAIDMLNDAINGNFRAKDIAFTEVKYLDEGVYNTQAKIIPLPGSGFQDPVVVKYDRISMEALFRGIEVSVVPANQLILSDYLPVINSNYGLSLTKDDIIDGRIPDGLTPPFKIGMKIKEGNPAFYGTIEVYVQDKSKSIKDMVDGIKLPGIRLPTNNGNTIQGPLYFYGEDFSELGKRFIMYLKDDVVDDRFVALIDLYDNNIWVRKHKPSEFNLMNAKVAYNGVLKAGNEYSNRKDFTNVLVIMLDETLCTNVSGYLVFHYNV